MKLFHIEPTKWEKLALSRSAWCSSVMIGANQYQKQMKNLAEQKCTKHKERAASVDIPLRPSCPVCGRTFHAKIGLISHLPIYNKT